MVRFTTDSSSDYSTDLPAPPEEPLDAAKAVGQGYSEAKWVAEELVRVVAERTAVRTTIVRIGQLTGSATGVWNSSEWLPALISASTALGHLPGGQGVRMRHGTTHHII